MLAVPSNKRASEVEQYGERAENKQQCWRMGTMRKAGWHPPCRATERMQRRLPPSHPPAEASAAAPARDDDDIPDIDELELEDARAR